MADRIPLTVKRESDTRWSARESAVRVIADSLDDLIQLLNDMNADTSESMDTRQKAGILLNSLLSFHFVCYLQFWNKILPSINVVQKRLQSPKMGIGDASADMHSLVSRFSDERSELCSTAINAGIAIANKWNISTEHRIRKRKKRNDETTEDASLTLVSEIDRVMKLATDTLITEIDERSKRLQELHSKFGFLLDVKKLIGDDDINEELLQQRCSDFATAYDGDVDAHDLQQEIMDCRMLFNKREQLVDPSDTGMVIKPQTPEQLLEAAVQYGKDVFPNLRTALQIMLTVAVSVASCERSFSKLKLIKTYLRATMKQDRLSDLAILSIEKATFESIDYSTIIDRFAENKTRKVIL